MSQFVETNLKAFTAGAAIDQYLRVKLASGVLQVATAADQALGTVEVESFASGDVVPVRLRTAVGSRKMVDTAVDAGRNPSRIGQGATRSNCVAARENQCSEGINVSRSAKHRRGENNAG